MLVLIERATPLVTPKRPGLLCQSLAMTLGGCTQPISRLRRYGNDASHEPLRRGHLPP